MESCLEFAEAPWSHFFFFSRRKGTGIRTVLVQGRMVKEGRGGCGTRLK